MLLWVSKWVQCWLGVLKISVDASSRIRSWGQIFISGKIYEQIYPKLKNQIASEERSIQLHCYYFSVFILLSLVCTLASLVRVFISACFDSYIFKNTNGKIFDANWQELARIILNIFAQP